MAPWQWLVLAIPALVLVLSIVMIVRTLMGATREPAESDGAVHTEPTPQQPVPYEAPVELGGEFDSLFVDGEERGSERAGAEPAAESNRTSGAEDSQWQRPPVSPVERETPVPQRAVDQPS